MANKVVYITRDLRREG